ncbi:MAG: sulfatase [Candidatus Lokiarchaeia archaeon]
MKHPNIFFIVFDTLRADKLFLKYNNVCLTPFLKKLVKNSIHFQNCIANSPWTLPSHISMFTGLYPSQNLLISEKLDYIGNKTPILAEILKDLGYSTICFTENAFISNVYGLVRGFEKVFTVWDWNPWIREKYPLSKYLLILNKIDAFIKHKIKNKYFLYAWINFRDRNKKLVKFLIKKLFLKHLLSKLKNDTIKDLDAFNTFLNGFSNENPIFIFFNFLSVHDPYIPLIDAFHLFDIKSRDFNIIRDMLVDPLKKRLDVDIKSKFLSKKEINTIERLYNSCVYSCDIVMKKLFDILQANNLLKDSYLIITSDHGEHLGSISDRFLWEHSTYQSVYEPLIKVPLILYNPDYKQKIINEQVQLKDLFHTILHLTGIPESKNKYLDKTKSIIHQLENNSTPKYIIGEYLKPKKEMVDLINGHRRLINKELISKIYNDIYFVRSENDKFIKYNKVQDEFFNLAEDQFEEIDIASENNSKYNKMKLKLESFLKKIYDKAEIKRIITSKEKDKLKKAIKKFSTNGL